MSLSTLEAVEISSFRSSSWHGKKNNIRYIFSAKSTKSFHNAMYTHIMTSQSHNAKRK
jgi:hypothetical protein